MEKSALIVVKEKRYSAPEEGAGYFFISQPSENEIFKVSKLEGKIFKGLKNG